MQTARPMSQGLSPWSKPCISMESRESHTRTQAHADADADAHAHAHTRTHTCRRERERERETTYSRSSSSCAKTCSSRFDYESPIPNGSPLADQYVQVINETTDALHAEVPGSQTSVCVACTLPVPVAARKAHSTSSDYYHKQPNGPHYQHLPAMNTGIAWLLRSLHLQIAKRRVIRCLQGPQTTSMADTTTSPASLAPLIFSTS